MATDRLKRMRCKFYFVTAERNFNKCEGSISFRRPVFHQTKKIMNHKMFLTVLLFLCFSFFAKAQINKGAVLLGGQIYNSIRTSKDNDQKDQQFNSAVYNISAGLAVQENRVAGINLSYNPATVHYYNNSNGNVAKTKSSNYSAAVFYRVYRNLGREFYFFGEFGAGYIGSKSKDIDYNGNDIGGNVMSGGQLNLTPGLSYKLMNKFYVEITIPSLVNIQYTVTKSKPSPPVSKQEQFTFNTSVNSNALSLLGVGFRIVL